MSNTSYTFKENSQMKDIQGGEKKVMKKILSVALSTAMAFSMFASVAFGAESLTPQQQFDALKAKGIVTGYEDGSARLDKTITRAELAKVIVKTLDLKEITGVYSFNDKNYKLNAKWPAPYIEAVTAAGIMEGKDKVKKIFDFNGNVTVEELATVLVRALKLEVPTTGVDNTATKWAQGYVQAAINAGLLEKGLNYQAAATRSQVVVAAYTIDQKNSIPTVASYKVVDANNVEFTLSNGEVVKVKLDKALEANKETAVEFKDSKGNTIATKVTYVVTTATKIASATANNLAQVVVTFDGEVDKTTAGDADNYSIYERDSKTTTKNIKSAVVSADGKSVTLTVAKAGLTPTGEFTNQLPYQLSFNNIKAGDKILSVKDFDFTPVDAALPTAESVQALGNKTIRVVFSEPVESANPSNFLVDGNSLVGNTKISGNTVIVKLYSALSDGSHKVTVTNVEDFAGFKSLSKELSFEVVKDTTAPTVTVESATFESVTVKFSEPVDPDTVLASNVYWLQGSTKKYPKAPVQQISDDTFKFDFSDNKIQYTTDLFVTNVKDYSGNAIAADTKVQVTPVLDQTRPAVVNAELNKDRKTITVKFSKAIEGASVDATDFVIKDADGKEVSKLKTATLTDSKTVTVVLAAGLTEGKAYTIEIAGINDTTTLKNVILPYSKQLTVEDKTAPVVDTANAAVRNTVSNSITITYPEAMQTSGDGSIVDRAKYSYYTAADGWNVLPGSVNVNSTPDGKSAILSFPDGIKVVNVTQVRVSLVKDVAGNLIDGLTATLTVNGAVAPTVGTVVATDNKTIEVPFNKSLLSSTVSSNDFTVKAGSVELNVVNAVVSSSDASKVVLTLADSNKLNANGTYGTGGTAVTVDVKANASTSTPAGIPVAAATAQAVTDKIAAGVDNVKGLANGNLQVTFNENLDTTVNKADAAFDFVIKNANGTISTSQYSVVSITDNVVVIHFNDPQTGVLEVALPNPRVLKGANDNTVVASSDALQVQVGDTTAPAAATTGAVVAANGTGVAGTIDAGDKITVKFSEPVKAANITLANITVAGGHSFGAGATIAPATAGTYADTYVITLGTAPTVDAGDTLTIAKANVVDNATNAATADVVFTVPAATNF